LGFGIAELDNMLEGGLPEHSLILLSGNPGTGKTILSTQFLYNGALKGERGVYVSFAESKDDYTSNMARFGMSMAKIEDEGKFKFIDFAVMSEPVMSKVLEIIISNVISFKAKRLVIDSINTVLENIDQNAVRTFIHSIVGRLVKSYGITAIIIGEIPFGKTTIGFGIEEFVADGVITLRHSVGAIERREMDILKMRGTAIDQSTCDYLIDEKYGGIGMVVLPKRSLIETVPTEKLSTGIPGLDKMLYGGVYKGSVTLIEGGGGVGKSTLCLQFLIDNCQKGMKALYISLEEPVGQIRRMLANYGMDFEQLGDSFILEAIVPEALSPLHYYRIIKDIVAKYRPSILAIDSVTAMRHTLSEMDFLELLRYIQLLGKEKGFTMFFTALQGATHEDTSFGASSIADNIILLRYYETKQRAGRELMIVKTRGSAHDKRIVSFDIGDRGIVVDF
jgi:circadian clock protein KaiC